MPPWVVVASDRLMHTSLCLNTDQLSPEGQPTLWMYPGELSNVY
jgi:hypothetical protein